MASVHEGDEAARREAMAFCAEDIRLTPLEALKLHPVGVELPDECHWILLHNTIRAGLHDARAYAEWLWGLDRASLAVLLEDYRQVALALQALTPDRHWLSKTFDHALCWPVLFDVFPDAPGHPAASRSARLPGLGLQPVPAPLPRHRPPSARRARRLRHLRWSGADDGRRSGRTAGAR